MWLIDLLGSDFEVQRAQLVLSSDEVARARRFHFERDARRYTIAHTALRTILGRYLALEPAELAFTTNPHGKPSLALGRAYSGASLSFNLSHSGELGLVAVARGRRVGVDIEQVRPEFANGQIAEHFFSPAEVHTLSALPAADRVQAFFRCWTRKEAFVKARGEGLSIPLNSFDVTLRADEPAALVRVANDPGEASRWSVMAVPVDTGRTYEAAVVVEGALPNIYAFPYMNNT